MTTDKKTDTHQLDHATLEVMRLRAIEAAKASMKATDLALAYGVASPYCVPPAGRLQ